ncbi:MAG: HipA domain-containing protein [Flavobacteriaceae bacterium]|nr:HipA domain-containing protein [Flavobacteriaceae bacterium]
MKNKCLYCYKRLEKGDYHQGCSLSFFGNKQAPELDYSLEQMNDLAKYIVERSVSVPGVQAKLSMSLLNQKSAKQDNRLTVVGALGGNYIFKPPTVNFPEMPENEHLTMKIAAAFDIKTVPTLIRLKSGELSYLTKRIDRTEQSDKIHMLDMFQITQAVNKYKSSMEKISKALNSYTTNIVFDKIQFFELTVFSFLFGNNDMHLKNFSMIETPLGWSLSPAYDLLNVAIINPEDKEELALTLNGKKNRLNKQDFNSFAINMGLNDKQINSVYKRLLKNKNIAEDLINISFLSKNKKVDYWNLVIRRYKRLF